MDRPVRSPQQDCRGYSICSGVTEKDEDLALFRNMGNRSDKTSFLSLGTGTNDQLIDAALSTKFGGLSNPHSARPMQRNDLGVELLDSDADRTDYDWLMTPPGTPLVPSMDVDSPVLQQDMIMNRSLAAIKTSRANTSSAIKANRGNPSPSRRSSTPQGSPRSLSAAMRSSNNHVPAKTANNNRPATPTRSSTPTSIRASLNPRPSTPTRQTGVPASGRPVTPMGARPATPTRRPATPISYGRPSSTPTLGRSSSSATGSLGEISARGNPSPTTITGSTGTSAVRGASPVRSTSSRGVSPLRGDSRAPSARGVSPAPSARGRSPSPSLRAPYPVEASDAIPPNLRTTLDRPSSTQRRPVVYGANLVEPVPARGGSPTPRRPPASGARSTAQCSNSIRQNVDKLSRAASSGVYSERSFDTCSQPGVSSHGLLESERSGSGRRMSFGRGSEDYVSSSSLGKAKLGSTSFPQCSGPSTSKMFFESAARENHRGQVAALRPFTTNSSISTFCSSRASGLLRRPLTPSSTASSSEHGATVAHHSEVDDEEAGSHWKPLRGQEHEAHSPLHLFENSLTSSLGPGLLDGTCIADNEEMSNFFKDSELPLELGPLTTVYAENHPCGKGVVKAADSASQNGETQQSNFEVITHNLDPGSGSRLDEASEKHFDYDFDCLGSKRDLSAEVAELLDVSGVEAATTLQDYSVDPAKERNRPFSGNTTSIHFKVEKINGVAKVSGIHADMSTNSKSQSIPGSAKNSRELDTSSSQNAMVLATRLSAKEDSVHGTVYPGSSTPKHMSSVKVSHKKPDKSELKRSDTARQATEGCKISQQSNAAAILSRKSNSNASMKSAAATAPHVNKEKPGRAASPARPLPANAKGPRQAAGSRANGEALEELSMHNRFSNITVRYDSNTQNFDCGPRSVGIFSVGASARSRHLAPVAQTWGRVAN